MKTNLTIEGMTCEMCVQHVTEALQTYPGVSAARVDLQNKSAVVEGDNYDVNQLLSAVEEEGYEAELCIVVSKTDATMPRRKRS